LQKKAALSTNASKYTLPAHGMSSVASPATASPPAPIRRRPHLRLPQRRMIRSDSVPPSTQEIIPAASGNAEHTEKISPVRWQWSLRYNGIMFVKKLPANPTKPYIAHSAQTSGERQMLNQLALPASSDERAVRPASRMASSPAFTPGMSSGRLRNQDQ